MIRRFLWFSVSDIAGACRWEVKRSIFLAGDLVSMEESSSSEALASVVETTPFVRDKQRTKEMNYICAIGSRIMKIIDRYLFDIGKLTFTLCPNL